MTDITDIPYDGRDCNAEISPEYYCTPPYDSGYQDALSGTAIPNGNCPPSDTEYSDACYYGEIPLTGYIPPFPEDMGFL